MKKIVVVGFVLILQGLNAFAQTNVVQLASQSVPYPELREQKPVAKHKTASVSVVLPKSTLSRNPKNQPEQSVIFHRISREGLLIPRISKDDPGAALETVFGSQNNQLGETGIRDPSVIIFPTGH